MMNKLMKKFFLAIVLVAFLPYTAFAKAPLTYNPYISNGSSLATHRDCSKIRLTCVDAEKIEVNSERTVKSLNKGILTLTINYNYKTINIKSYDFGLDIDFYGCFEYQEKKEQSKDSKGKLHDFSIDTYLHEHNEGLTYIRTEDKSLVLPMLQVFHNGYRYNFNITYAEIYDFDHEKWVYGQTLATGQEGDKVKGYLIDRIGGSIFCSNFEERILGRSLEDSLCVANSDDPWDNN